MRAGEQASAEYLLGSFLVVRGNVCFNILLPVLDRGREGGEQPLVDGGGLADGESKRLVGEDLGGLDVVDVHRRRRRRRRRIPTKESQSGWRDWVSALRRRGREDSGRRSVPVNGEGAPEEEGGAGTVWPKSPLLVFLF